MKSRRSVRAVSAVLVTMVVLAPLPVGATEGRAVAPRPVPGPIARGFEGLAYPVPAKNEAADPNAVRVTLVNEAGENVGTDSVPAGRMVRVSARDGDPDHVTIRRGGGVTAIAPRARFWVMPSFVELKDMTVRVDGTNRPLGESGLKYHRGNTTQFDDPRTPGYDGTTVSFNRAFLACRRDSWGIGGQTFAVDPIEDGLHRRDKSLIDAGIQAVDWGVAVPINEEGVHELHRDCDNKTVADYGYTHHATQWLESMSRAVYLLAASEWAGDYRPKIDAYIRRIEEVASLLTEPGNWAEWKGGIRDEDGHDFTHRTFMMAAALGLASTLTDEPRDSRRWAERAAMIARRGIENQTRSGVFPERGGFDVLYQMYGTWLAELYLSSLGEKSGMARRMEKTIDRAVGWMTGRINERTGQIKIRGTTRVCVETFWVQGQPVPTVDPSETIRAFLLWGHLRSDQELIDLAILVDAGQKEYGNPCPADLAAPPDQQPEE